MHAQHREGSLHWAVFYFTLHKFTLLYCISSIFSFLYFIFLKCILLYFTLFFIYFSLLYFTLLYLSLHYFTLQYLIFLYFTLLWFFLLYFSLLSFTLLALHWAALHFNAIEFFLIHITHCKTFLNTCLIGYKQHSIDTQGFAVNITQKERRGLGWVSDDFLCIFLC